MVHNVKCQLFAAALMICACAQKQDGNDIIVMQDAGPASDFVSQVRAVRLIPLGNPSFHQSPGRDRRQVHFQRTAVHHVSERKLDGTERLTVKFK